MNKKIIITILSIFVIATTLSGCVTGPKTVETPEGKVSIKEGGAGPEWCKAGTTITQKTGEQESSYTIKGMTTYKGNSVCEAEMSVSGQGIWKYYFTEDYKYAVVVMKDPSGKEQEIMVNDPSGK